MKYEINPAYREKYKEFLLNIQKYFHQNQNSIHKARNELKIISHKEMQTVVKSFKIPNAFRRIFYTFFRDSKAKKSYDNSFKIGTFAPAPIGYIEFFTQGLLAESYFIAEKFDYDFTIREPLLDKSFPDRENILKAFARFSLQLHNANIFHNDYSPGNILIKKEGSDYIFKIVDVNRMDFFVLQETQRAKSFAKLWASNADLHVIAQEYMQHHKVKEDFVQKVIDYSVENKKRKNFKKRLKGEAVDW
jgi:serine/threonine protein kinase